MKVSWKQNRSTTMLRKKLEAGRGSRHSKLGCVIKIVTTRHICLSVIAVLCCLSVILSLSRFTVQPSTTPRSHSNVPRSLAFHQRPGDENDVGLDRHWENDSGQRRLPFDVAKNDAIRQQAILAARSKKLIFRKQRVKDRPDSRKSIASNDKAVDEDFSDESSEARPDLHDHVITDNSDVSSTARVASPVDGVGDEDEQSESMARLFEGASKDVHGPDALLAGNEAIESTTIDPLRMSFLNNIAKYVKKTKARYGAYYKQPITLLPEQNKGVIIVTNYRSGSTFLGELFNQHPDAFYTFEPLIPFTSKCDQQVPLKVELLQEILKCDFQEMDELYKKITLPFRKTSLEIECLIDNFCFRKKTADLCDKKLCPFGRLPGCNRCGPLHLPRVKNACRAKKMSVIKTIRICDINQLKTIAMDPTLDFKIIHLVRDPRGIESSRMKINKRWPLLPNSESTCNRLLHNAMSGLAKTNATEWMKGRYMRIRYEDLALKPLSYAEKIYQFVGLEFVRKVKVWIMQNTHPDSAAGTSYRQKKNRKNPYGTTRNSAAVMEAWRKHLTFEQVSQVQSKCMRTLSYFGYEPVHSEKELHNFDVQLVR